MKNRMLEIGTSGSVRGGDGNIPTYSAFDAPELVKPGGEGRGLGKTGEVAEEAQFAGVECLLQVLEEQSTKQAREHAHRQEEAGAASVSSACRRARCRHPVLRNGCADGAAGSDPR